MFRLSLFGTTEISVMRLTGANLTGTTVAVAALGKLENERKERVYGLNSDVSVVGRFALPFASTFTPSTRAGIACWPSSYISSEFLDRVVHGLRGLDHCQMPCIGNDPHLRLLHQTRYSIHPGSSRARRKRYTLQIGVHISGL